MHVGHIHAAIVKNLFNMVCSHEPAVLNRERFCPQGANGQYAETFSAVTTRGQGAPGISRNRPDTPLNILQSPQQPPQQRMIWSPVSPVLAEDRGRTTLSTSRNLNKHDSSLRHHLQMNKLRYKKENLGCAGREGVAVQLGPSLSNLFIGVFRPSSLFSVLSALSM